MVEKRYNILWIDDKHQELKGFKMQAKINGISLFAFKSMNAGLAELENNSKFYDSILLDAIFLENENDESGSEDLSNLEKTKDRILQLSKKFERFILTGQQQLFNDRTFKSFYPKIYRKGIPKDIDKLFEAIKTSADQQLITQIKHEFQDVLDSCSEKYIGKKNYNTLLELLVYLKSDEVFNSEKLNTIRKIFEAFLYASERYNLFPKFYFNKRELNMTQSLLYMQGDVVFIPSPSKWEVKLSRTKCLPDIISSSAFYIKDITSIGSHYEDDSRVAEEDGNRNKVKIAELQQFVDKPYLIKSLIYQLMDILLWFKAFIDKNSDPEVNAKEWHKPILKNETEEEWVGGKVSKIADNGWGTFLPGNDIATISIPPSMVSEHNLKENQEIELLTEPSPDGKKTFIKRIKSD